MHCDYCDDTGIEPCDNCGEVDEHTCHLDGEEYGPTDCRKGCAQKEGTMSYDEEIEAWWKELPDTEKLEFLDGVGMPGSHYNTAACWAADNIQSLKKDLQKLRLDSITAFSEYQDSRAEIKRLKAEIDDLAGQLHTWKSQMTPEDIGMVPVKRWACDSPAWRFPDDDQ